MDGREPPTLHAGFGRVRQDIYFNYQLGSTRLLATQES